MKRKVIIEALPKAKTGQQVGGSLYNTPALMGGLDRNKSNQTGKATRTIGAVPREQANLEAEGGETVVGDLTGIGIPQHFTISGPRHAQGGVPMDLPDNSFIFSDFNQMTIKDPTALEYFGKAVKKGGKGKGYTPAEIAKQYDNNKNIETLKNKNSDKLDRKTAELNLKNNNMKLGALALLQEAKKGFENGIPELSYPYLEKLGVNPEEMFGQQEQGLPQAKKGGAVKKLKRKQDGGELEYNNLPPTYVNALRNFVYPNVVADPRRTGYNALNNTISYDPESDIENVNNNWWMEHELFHDLQNQAGALSTYGLVGQRPNQYVASDEAIESYYDRRNSDINKIVDQMIEQNPELQFVPRELLIKGSPGFTGAEYLQYEDPSTVEGEAREYEQYIESGNPSIFPKKQNGGMMPPPEMMQQQQMQNPIMGQAPAQDPMQQVMMMVQQMMEQGAAPEDVVMELLNNQIPPDVIVQVLTQMGMPQEQAVQIIQGVMSQEQPMGDPGMEQGMDPSMMEGQGMTPDMMPAMDPSMAMMQMGGAPNPNDSLTQEIMSALDQGASPEEVIEFLIQQGVPEQEASQMVMGLVQRASFETQPSMYKGGELPKAQTGAEPYSMDKAYGPEGIKRLNTFLPTDQQLPLDATPAQVKAKVTEIQKGMKGNYGNLVIDYMLNVSEQPNAKLNKILNEKLGTKNKKYTKADLLTLHKEGKIKDADILEGFEDQQWWYRMPSTQTRKTKDEAEYKAFKEDPNTIQQGDFFYKHLGDGKYETLILDKAKDDEKDPDNKDNKDGVRPEIKDPNIQGVRSPDVAEWTAPDIYNFRGAIQDRLGIKSYYPWAARFNPQFMDPTFYDPSRELAAQAEQANILTQGLGQFTGPQAASARAAQIQGQGAKQAADTLGRYNNLNVGLQNQFAGQNTQIANQAQQYNQAKAQELYDKGVITQQQRDNAIRQANQQIRQGFAQGWKNASDIAMINANQEQYKVDPFTGTVFHTGVTRDVDPTQQGKDYDAKFKEYLTLTPNNPDAAAAAANAWLRSQSGKASFAKGGYVLGANIFPFMFY